MDVQRTVEQGVDVHVLQILDVWIAEKEADAHIPQVVEHSIEFPQIASRGRSQ